jgi:hypothetical protein
MPMIDRLFDQPGLSKMLREQLGLCLGRLRELLFEHLRDPSVVLSTAALEKACVGRVAYQCVLKV